MGIISELYELSNDYLQVLDMMDDDTWDEQTVRDTLEAVEGEFDYKADSMAKIIKSLQAKSDAVKEEIDRLTARRKSFENKAEFFKAVLFQNMQVIGKKKIKTALFTISIAKNGGKEPLKITGNIEDIPGKYLIPQDPIPNTDAIRALLAEKEVDWAHLEPRGEHLGIR